MSLPDRHYGVWLGDLRVGTLTQRGDHTVFTMVESYLDDPARPVLGLVFEQDVGARHAATMRLPPWFSNLLPEGRLRDWIALERGVSAHREMELLAQVGHDLPGAIRVRPVAAGEISAVAEWSAGTPGPPEPEGAAAPWRFSLAGVALKFSMLAEHDRLTMPASGIGGDWIVKLPDRFFPEVPRNEFTMMSLARDVGIDVPEIRMVHRDEVVGLPSGVWPDQGEWAYAVRRFDRDDRHGLIHIEDLAQVRNVYPDDKYRGNFETVGSLIYRGRDVDSLREYCRRLVFSILISNGDAHLKNWSLIYRDPRIPALAPAYDLVSTRYYMGTDEEFGLRFGGTKRYERIRLSAFDRLERRIGSDAGLADTGRALIKAMLARWPDRADSLRCADGLRRDIDASITQRSATLAGS